MEIMKHLHVLKTRKCRVKSAYLIGSGLASLAAACFLIRDGQMDGSKIHVLEEISKPGGSLDGDELPLKGYVVRGKRNGEPFRMFVGFISLHPVT